MSNERRLAVDAVREYMLHTGANLDDALQAMGAVVVWREDLVKAGDMLACLQHEVDG